MIRTQLELVPTIGWRGLLTPRRTSGLGFLHPEDQGNSAGSHCPSCSLGEIDFPPQGPRPGPDRPCRSPGGIDLTTGTHRPRVLQLFPENHHLKHSSNSSRNRLSPPGTQTRTRPPKSLPGRHRLVDRDPSPPGPSTFPLKPPPKLPPQFVQKSTFSPRDLDQDPTALVAPREAST